MENKKNSRYGDFQLDTVIKLFDLKITVGKIFEQAPKITPDPWLQTVLEKGLKLPIGSEKARSEFIVSPILLALRDLSQEQISIYSGMRFDVEPDKGLRGFCDFIITKSPPLPIVQAPVVMLVEAKKHDIEENLGQCTAEMVAAQIFNRREQSAIKIVYGCVTSGTEWQFLQLAEDNVLLVDKSILYLNELSDILGKLKAMVS